jgi:hypothetical protein
MRKLLVIVIVIASLASLAFAGLKTTGIGESKQFDASEFPADMKAMYDIMKVKCIKCHTLERVVVAITTGVAPISGQPFDKKSTKEYGIKMMRKPGSNMSKDETKSVVKLLDFMLDEAAK